MPTLTWTGKDKVVNHHHDVPLRVLNREYTHTAPEGSPVNSTDNRIIHGDNLEVLKSLLPEFEGKVNCIYIDPPYNTGNQGWIYNDAVNDPKIKKWLGQTVGKEGEDLTRHDKWLCMMYPRLKLLHRLLADDGVIFISIDDAANYLLRCIANEIFGTGNFIGSIIWKKKTNGNNMGHIPPVHDYLICYSKNTNLLKLAGFSVPNEFIEKNYSNTDNDSRGAWKTQDLSANHKGPYFEITNPISGETYLPPRGRYWVFNQEEVAKRIADGRIIFGKSGNARPAQKVFLKDKSLRRKAESWWDNHGMNSDGTGELADLFPEKTDEKIFDHPKPSIFIENILHFSTTKESLILDSFAGSGTTAHATLKLNAQDGGNRRFILVEMMDYAKTITAARVQRVMSGYGEGDKLTSGTGGSFSYYNIGEALFLPDENLNESVGIEVIRDYVAYTENIPHDARTTPDNPVSPYLLGQTPEAAWLFNYEPDRTTSLDMEFLSSLNFDGKRPSLVVAYADACLLSADFLQKYGLVFKKIPRDISRL